MEFYDEYFIKGTGANRKIVKVRGVPVVNRFGLVHGIDVKKSFLDLWGQFTPAEMKRLEKKAAEIQTNLIYCIRNNKEYNIDILEDQLTDIYDRMLFMLCTGDTDTLRYKKDWMDDWYDDKIKNLNCPEDDDESLYFYVGFLFDEKLFKDTCHVIAMFAKNYPFQQGMLTSPFKNYIGENTTHEEVIQAAVREMERRNGLR